MDWLIYRRSEMQKIFWLIEGSQLKMLELAKIKMFTASLCVLKKKKGCCCLCNLLHFYSCLGHKHGTTCTRTR